LVQKSENMKKKVSVISARNITLHYFFKSLNVGQKIYSLAEINN